MASSDSRNQVLEAGSSPVVVLDCGIIYCLLHCRALIVCRIQGKEVLQREDGPHRGALHVLPCDGLHHIRRALLRHSAVLLQGLRSMTGIIMSLMGHCFLHATLCERLDEPDAACSQAFVHSYGICPAAAMSPLPVLLPAHAHPAAVQDCAWRLHQFDDGSLSVLGSSAVQWLGEDHEALPGPRMPPALA